MGYTDEYIRELAELTTGQSTNIRWRLERVGRIMSTAAYLLIPFSYKILEFERSGCRSIPYWLERDINFHIKCFNKFNNYENIPEIKWGIDHENEGIRAYVSRTGYSVKPTGLWISPSGSMSSSPDGLIYTEDENRPAGILEVKCPFRFRFNKYMSKYDFMKLEYLNPDLSLRRDHKHYHRAQAEMYATRTKWCDFVVWTPADMLVTRVHLEPEWVEKNVPLIDYVFNNYLIHGSNKKEEIESGRRLLPPNLSRAPNNGLYRNALKRKHQP